MSGPPSSPPVEQAPRREQYAVFRQIEDGLELPMLALSLIWGGLLFVELIWGIGPWLEVLVTAIWIAFIAELALKFVLAPNRIVFLRRNWLGVFALLLPALRVFRAVRVFQLLRYGRVVRGLTMARLLTAFNRGLRSLRNNVGRYALGYVFALTVLVTLLGAGGIYAFERQADRGIRTFEDALWFSAMTVTNVGAEYRPKTGEGRLLCLLLAFYAFAIFGYVTASLASLLIGQQPKTNRESLEASELRALRAEVAELGRRIELAVAQRRDAS